jgi:hypothetical protein
LLFCSLELGKQEEKRERRRKRKKKKSSETPMNEVRKTSENIQNKNIQNNIFLFLIQKNPKKIQKNLKKISKNYIFSESEI